MQGRYLPLFASAVSDGNLKLKKHGKAEINLQSVMIGNGITDLCKAPSASFLRSHADVPVSTTESYYDFVSISA